MATRKQRTDVHRPSQIIPADYEYVAPEYLKIESLGDAEALKFYREQIRRHMEKTGGTYSRHEHGGNCMVCGTNNAIYTILFYHAKSNSYVRMGTDCAQEVDARFSDADVKGMRRIVQAAIEAIAGKKKAQAVLAEAGLSAAWEVHLSYRETLRTFEAASDAFYRAASAQYAADIEPFDTGKPEHTADYMKLARKWERGGYYTDRPARPKVLDAFEEKTIDDMVGKLIKYGSLSEKQLSFMRKLLDKMPQREQIAAERAAQDALAADCPSGRVDFQGTVLSTKFQENDFGDVYKMLVKADEGFKVWCTVPSNLADLCTDRSRLPQGLRGQRIDIRVTITPSQDDKKFGFGSRPSARLLETEESKQA